MRVLRKWKPPRNMAASPTGDVQTEVGQPNDLILQYTTRNDDIRPGDSIVSEYGTHTDGVYECRNLRQLEAFVEKLA